MAWTDNGGSAFPIQHSNEPGGLEGEAGMSLRDYFAIHAREVDLIGYLPAGAEPSDRASARYRFADAMLAERKRTGGD